MRVKILLGLLVLAAWAGAQNVATAPDEVTVYPAGAKVLRRGQAELSPGPQKISFEGLPAGLREDSLRLKMEGPKGSLVYSLNLREAFTNADQAKRRAGLAERIQSLEDSKADLADRISSRKAEVDILKALAEKGAARAGNESAAKINELAGSVAVVGKRLDALALAARKDERAAREIDTRLAALRAEQGQAGPGERSHRVAEADVELPEAGACRFELSYFVDQAGWSPRYDLRLKASEKDPKVEIDFLAELRQLSGEDWNDVALSLSTARPTLDSQVPDPSDWWLDFAYVLPLRKSYGVAMSAAADAAMPPAMERAPQEEAAMPQAAVQDLGPATLFTVKRRASVPSLSQGTRVSVARSEQAAELLLVVVPRLSKDAYLEAKILYSGEQPLLPGPAQLFRDGDLAGQVSLPNTAPGESFSLGFGMDERVKAERKRRLQKEGSAGIFSGKNRRAYDWDIKVSNFHEGTRDIEVREQLPRSRQDSIKVAAIELDPKPLPEDPAKPGLQIWKLQLKKGEVKTLRLRYEVSWPEGQRVSGIE